MSKLRVAFNNVYRLILGFRKRDSASCMFVFNNVYRLILGFRKRDSASCMFVSSRIDSFEAKTRKTCYTFRQRMVVSTNSVIFAIHNNNWFLSHYLRQRWENLLYIYPD